MSARKPANPAPDRDKPDDERIPIGPLDV